jgi:hypothetical protein
MWIFLFCSVVIYVQRGLFIDPEGYAFECTLRDTGVLRDFFYSESTVIYKRITRKFTRFIAFLIRYHPPYDEYMCVFFQKVLKVLGRVTFEKFVLR